MGHEYEKEGLVYPNLCIYLLEQNPDRQRYLTQILSFVEGEIRIIDADDDIVPLLKREPQNGCTAIALDRGHEVPRFPWVLLHLQERLHRGHARFRL